MPQGKGTYGRKVGRPPKLDIDKAIKKPGSFTAQAKRAGFADAKAYAKFVLAPKNEKKTTAKTKQRARFVQTLAKVRKGKK